MILKSYSESVTVSCVTLTRNYLIIKWLRIKTTVTFRVTVARKRLIVRQLQNKNRNTFCYDYRNKKCYDFENINTL